MKPWEFSKSVVEYRTNHSPENHMDISSDDLEHRGWPGNPKGDKNWTLRLDGQHWDFSPWTWTYHGELDTQPLIDFWWWENMGHFEKTWGAPSFFFSKGFDSQKLRSKSPDITTASTVEDHPNLAGRSKPTGHDTSFEKWRSYLSTMMKSWNMIC